MLKSIKLVNFRKFVQFSLSLGPGNVLVGPNNAGKSSILDALRLLDSAMRFTNNKTPENFSISDVGVVCGYRIPASGFSSSLANIAHNYNYSETVLEFQHENGNRGTLNLDPQRSAYFYIEGAPIRMNSGKAFRAAFPVDLVIVPTLAPLEAEEPYVTDETVRRNERTRLASRALRNIWLRRPAAEFEEFKQSVE